MTDLSVMLNFINYAFVLFFGITTSLCLADISFRTQRIYLLFYLAFGMGQFLFYLIFAPHGMDSFHKQHFYFFFGTICREDHSLAFLRPQQFRWF